MVNKIMYQRIQNFKKRGCSKSDLIRTTGLNKRTVIKYFDMTEKQYLQYIETVKDRIKIFEPFKPNVLEVYRENDFQKLEKAAVYDYLEEQCGSLPATERSFRNYINYLTDTGQLIFNENPRRYHPVEELPYGKQMQIDFGEYQTKKGMKLYMFGAVLSASRYKYCSYQLEHFTTLDLINHLLDCFEYMEGMPEELVIDQDAVMVLKENAGDIIYTKDFKHFREEMGLKIYVCRKSDPETKGKIENFIKFIKRNFLRLRDFDGLSDVLTRSFRWLSRRANGRISLATRRIPREMFEEEKKYLRPLRNSIYRSNISVGREKRKVDTLGAISVNSCKYPVPEDYRNREVEIYKTNEILYIYDIRTGEKIQEHEICAIPGTKVKNRNRSYRKETQYGELKEKLQRLFPLELWEVFVEKNYQAFPRYFRDQHSDALKKFSNRINTEYLKQALKICLDNRTYSMANLYDTYLYCKQEAELDIPDSKLGNNVELKNISRKSAAFQIETRDIEVYNKLVAEARP